MIGWCRDFLPILPSLLLYPVIYVFLAAAFTPSGKHAMI